MEVRADQLPYGHVRNYFYECPFDAVEYAMATNMGGGLPITGFFEMKQEIYEIARKLQNKIFVSEIFNEEL